MRRLIPVKTSFFFKCAFICFYTLIKKEYSKIFQSLNSREIFIWISEKFRETIFIKRWLELRFSALDYFRCYLTKRTYIARNIWYAQPRRARSPDYLSSWRSRVLSLLAQQVRGPTATSMFFPFFSLCLSLALSLSSYRNVYPDSLRVSHSTIALRSNLAIFVLSISEMSCNNVNLTTSS